MELDVASGPTKKTAFKLILPASNKSPFRRYLCQSIRAGRSLLDGPWSHLYFDKLFVNFILE